MSPRRPPAILLAGPTASGKSAAAMMLAEHFPVEIVSVDSAQVYRDMDIGTAKPTAAERSTVPHHLVDIIPPTEPYSAARFRADALASLHDITARGRVPLLVGGTMLYFKALREGLAALPPSDAAVRAEIDAEAAARGWPALHCELASVDPPTAARLNVNDAQRIQRALEVFRLTRRPLSALLRGGHPADLPFRLVALALVPRDRGRLHERIAARFDAMLRAGLVDEVASLRSRFALDVTLPSMRCVGYRQVWGFLEGRFGTAELRDRGIFATRQLAKRQLTWLRSAPDTIALDCFAPAVADDVRNIVARALGGSGEAVQAHR